jgi:hypothetical protein
MELFVETHMLSDDRQKGVQRLIDSKAQHFMVCWFSTFFFEVIIFLNLLTFFS